MKVGTRGSSLATVQTKSIINALSKITHEKIDMEIIKTTGDKIQDSQLYNIDAKGIFTRELDNAVLQGDVDFAVHSLKDLPTELEGDLEIVAIPQRESSNEVLVSEYEWDELPSGAIVGTSSIRREAFCNFHKKDFSIKTIRGNIDTRIKKVLSGDYDATIMAEAGIKRLGLNEHIKKRFSIEYFTPAAGQGAIAVVARHDSDKRNILKNLNHLTSFQEVTAEKRVLQELGVGCQWPLGVSANIKENKLKLCAVLLTKEGKVLSRVKVEGSADEASKLGLKAAKLMMEDYI
ncbi:hydroxymethylbilane synthase [Methanobacterium spitsbergense]|uniref:Probable porphobilinogen deaminase n=1 Tax=Methanobacterium spitsbergense TaxID=2874285 RepID=A0A8T5UWY1_9EURY|nr:hydroxymethylbilane synthase [Methanobacterium spitsbergense]MBZ2165343.1 hydroxymethylbilane synthase [Methanobacterium spitsbergense]